MIRLACVLLAVLALAGCVASGPLPEAVPGSRASDPYATAARAAAEYDAANAAIRGAEQAQASTRQAATMEAQRTEAALTQAADITRQAMAYSATEQSSQATQASYRFTQAAGMATEGALRLTQSAEQAQAASDQRLFAQAQHLRETALVQSSDATATAVAGAMDRQAATDGAVSILVVGGALALVFALLAAIIPWWKRNNARAPWILYPAKNPRILVNVITGEIIELSPLPSLPQPAPAIRHILVNPDRDERPAPQIVDVSQDGLRGKALKLLTMAADLTNRSDGALEPDEGWRTSVIPGHRELNEAGYRITPNEWQSVVTALKRVGLVSTKPGATGGTYTNGRSLGQVYQLIEHGEVKLPYPARVHVNPVDRNDG